MNHARVAVLALLALAGLCLLGASSASAQSAFSEDINETFGGSSIDSFSSIDEKSGGGFALGGSASFGPGFNDLWLVTTDSGGNRQLNVTLGGSDPDGASSVVQTPGGDFVLAGSTESFTSASDPFTDAWFVKVDSGGNVVVNETYGTDSRDSFNSVVRTQNGNFAFAGRLKGDAWLLKTEPNGNVLVNKTYESALGETFSSATSLVQTSGGGFALAGWAGPTVSETDAALIKTDQNGNVDFAETIGPGNPDTDDGARSVIQTSDGGLAFVGEFGDEGFSGPGEPDAWLVKREPSGSISINETFGGADEDFANSVIQTPGDDFALTGGTSSFSGGTRPDLWLIKTDSNGNKELDETYGGSSGESARSLVDATEGGTFKLAFGGSTGSFGPGNTAAWLLKITDVPPTVDSINIPGSANEGDSVTLDAEFSDPGPGDEYTATIDWGDGETTTLSQSEVDQNNEQFSATHTYDDDGSYTVTVTVFDDDEGSGQDTASLTVNNVAPTVSIDSLPGSANEGDVVNLDASFDDPGTADTHTATVDWGDGTTETVSVDQASNTLSATHTYEDDGSYTVTVTVEDDDGGTGSDSGTVNVANVPPDVTIDSLPGSANEGDVVSLNASFSDPGTDDTHTATVDWGDGTTESVPVDQASNTLSATHTYDDDGSYAVTVAVTDDDEGTGSESGTVNVANVPPNVTIDSITGSSNEADAVSLNASFDDPGNDTHTATVDWDDGTTESVPVDQENETLSATHVYEDDDSYDVTVAVEDDDGGVGTDTETVNVENVAPTVSIDSLPDSVDEGETVPLTASFTDPGNDTHTATVDWGDGTTESVGVDQANDTLSAAHKYYVDVEVSYTVTVTVEDDDGGTDAANDTVRVDDLCINRRSVSRGQEEEECPRDRTVNRDGSREELDRETERRSDTRRRDRGRGSSGRGR